MLTHNIEDEIPDSFPAIKRKPLTRGHPLSPESVEWVKSHFFDCFQNHGGCTAVLYADLPRRILFFEYDQLGMITVRLQEPSSKRDHYAALSHCWGKQQVLTTTTDTIEARKKAIDWNKIPQTFQDSIRYCLVLGIHYLWIDALCIVQDDLSDWEIESAKMADIYQNALITLAATSAMDSSAGMFNQTLGKLGSVVEMDSVIAPIMVREKLAHWTSSSHLVTLQQWPLLMRGWAFQERCLSKRVLHFCKQELIWECFQISDCECGGMASTPPWKQSFVPTENRVRTVPFSEVLPQLKKQSNSWSRAANAAWIPRRRRRNNSPRREEEGYHGVLGSLFAHIERDEHISSSLPNSSSQTQNISTRHRLPDIRCRMEAMRIRLKGHLWTRNSHRHAGDTEVSPDVWHRIVEEFSRLQLTNLTDCLPALSGIAKENSLGFRNYTSGLWEDCIQRDLLWRVDRLHPEAKRPNAYRGPSWSWVSVTSPVNYWTSDQLHEHEYPTMAPPQSINHGIDIARREEKFSFSPELEFCHSEIKGQNPFGEVKGGELRLAGKLCSARLKYTSVRTGITGRQGTDPLHYIILLQHQCRGNMELPFFADYILSDSHDDFVPDYDEVFLLEILCNLFLVLKEDPSKSAYRRIGILMCPVGLIDGYHMNLGAGIKYEKHCISVI